MRMKIVALILSAGLSGCGFIATNAVPESEAVPVPENRILAMTEKKAGLEQITIIRESGMLGGGCYVGLEIDKTLVARFDTSEIARFWVKPGEREFAVTRDPMGRGLCGGNFETPAREMLRVDPQNYRFKISFRMYRRPEVEPY